MIQQCAALWVSPDSVTEEIQSVLEAPSLAKHFTYKQSGSLVCIFHWPFSAVYIPDSFQRGGDSSVRKQKVY